MQLLGDDSRKIKCSALQLARLLPNFAFKNTNAIVSYEFGLLQGVFGIDF
jgi:hypothetical protein